MAFLLRGFVFAALAVSGHAQIISIVVLDAVNREATQKHLALDVVDAEVGEHMLARARLPSNARRFRFQRCLLPHGSQGAMAACCQSSGRTRYRTTLISSRGFSFEPGSWIKCKEALLLQFATTYSQYCLPNRWALIH